VVDVREREFEAQGDRPAQSEALAVLQRLADAAGNESRRADVTRRLAHLAYHTGDYSLARERAQQACALARRAHDERQALRAQQTLAISLHALGELDAAKALALQGLTAARARSDRHLESRFVNALSVIATRQGDPYGSYLYDQEMGRIARETGNLRDEAVALANLGVGLMGFGDFDAAKGHLDQSLHLARAVGARFVEPHVLRYQAELAVLCGDAATAVACARDAIDCAIRDQNKLAEAEGTLTLADAELQLGRHERACLLYGRSFELCSELGNPIALDARAGLARVALARGDAPGALEQVEAVLAHQVEHGNLDGSNSPQFIRLVCWTVLRACADARAVDLLEQAYQSLMAQAARLGDARLRELFLSRIPANVEVARARAATGGRA
jgi:tetratricopeptide (TPR) repeat protein